VLVIYGKPPEIGRVSWQRACLARGCRQGGVEGRRWCRWMCIAVRRMLYGLCRGAWILRRIIVLPPALMGGRRGRGHRWGHLLRQWYLTNRGKLVQKITATFD
jgi:hypothetical protein